MPPHEINIFLVFFLITFSGGDDVLAEKPSNEIWHSYSFKSGASNREGLNFKDFKLSEIGSANHIKKWETIKSENVATVLGLGDNFLLLKLLNIENDYLFKIDLNSSLSDFATFSRWNPESQITESFLVVAGCEEKNKCFLKWYEVINTELVFLWNLPFNRQITHLNVKILDYEFKLVVVSHFQNARSLSSVEIYSFAADRVFDLWQYDRFSLDDIPSSVTMSQCNDETFLYFLFPEMDVVYMYKNQNSSSGHNHFKLHQKIFSENITSLTSFSINFHCYLAIAGANSSIYTLQDNSQMMPNFKMTIGNLSKWFDVPLNTYREDIVLFAEGESDTLVYMWSENKGFYQHSNLSDLVCGTDHNCTENMKYFSTKFATSFKLNNYINIIFTSKLGDSMVLNFSVKMEQLQDSVQMELQEILKNKFLLEEKWKEQENKILKLKERNVNKIFNSNENLSTDWQPKNLKEDLGTVELEPSTGTDYNKSSKSTFEYSLDKKRTNNDYSIFSNKLINSESHLKKNINRINNLLKRYENFISNENFYTSDIIMHDVKFLGNVTVNELELIHLNGIDANDMLLNSFVLGSPTKIGGTKTIMNINAENISFEKLNEILACDIMFADDVGETIHANIINGDVVYENDIIILNALELMSQRADKIKFKLYPNHHRSAFNEKLTFDYLFIGEELIVEQTINGRPLILPVRNAPFDIQSFYNVNHARLEHVNVEHNLNVSFLNGRDFRRILHFPKRKSNADFGVKSDKALTIKNLHIEYLNDIKFPEGFITTDSQGINTISGHKYFNERLIVDDLFTKNRDLEKFFQNPIKIRNTKHSYKNIEIHGVLSTEMINDNTWKSFADIIKQNEKEVINITGTKHFGKFAVSKDLKLNGTLNNVNVDNIMNSVTDQEITHSQIFSHLELSNLSLSGTWNGIRIDNLNDSVVRLSKNGKYESNLVFSNESIPYFKSLILTEFLNNIVKPSSKNKEILTVKKNIQMDSINIKKLIINGSLTSHNQVNDINLTNFNSQRMSRSKTQTIQRQLNYQNITVNGNLNVLYNRNFKTFDIPDFHGLNSIYAFFNKYLTSIKSISVKGNVKTLGRVNNFNLYDIERNVVFVTRPNLFHRKIIFNDIITINDLKIQGRLNGINLKRFHQDLIYETSYVSIKAPKTFLKYLTITGNMKIRSLNDHLIRNIITKDGNHLLNGTIHINGDVVVRGNISSYGLINDRSVSDLFVKYSNKHDAYVISNDIALQVAEIDHLVVDGNIKNKSFNSFILDAVLLSDDSNITARKVFVGSVNFNKNIFVEETLNGLKLSQFYKDIVFADQEIMIDGDIITNKAIMKKVEVKNDFNSTLIHGFDINEWLEESISLDKDVGISGKKKIKNIHCTNNIAADYINDHLSATIIPLNKDQFIPGTGFFSRMHSTSDILIERFVNEKVLSAEYSKTVMLDENQEINGIITFNNDVFLKGNITLERVNDNNIRNVITLNTDQEISSVITFEDLVVANKPIQKLMIINDINLKEWRDNWVSINENQTVKGSWTVAGNITMEKSVNGDGMLDGNSLPDILKSIVKVEMFSLDIQNKTHEYYEKQCKEVENFAHKISLQPNTFHEFDITQVLKISQNIESAITFQANTTDYLLLTFFNECLSLLFKWNILTSNFNYKKHINIGPVSKWITLYGKNGTYLITTSYNDSNCEINSKRGNIWIFSGDENEEYGHIYISEGFADIIKESDFPGKYYTLTYDGDVYEWTIDNDISKNLLFRLGEANNRFLTFDTFGELTFTNGREIKNRQNSVIYKFEKPFHGRINVAIIGGKKLFAVSFHDEIVIYEDIIESKIYATIPAFKAGSVLWFNLGLGYTFLTYERQEKSVDFIHFKGTSGYYTKISIPISCYQLLAIPSQKKKVHQQKQQLLVVQSKKILLLKANFLGNLYEGLQNDCI